MKFQVKARRHFCAQWTNFSLSLLAVGQAVLQFSVAPFPAAAASFSSEGEAGGGSFSTPFLLPPPISENRTLAEKSFSFFSPDGQWRRWRSWRGGEGGVRLPGEEGLASTSTKYRL